MLRAFPAVFELTLNKQDLLRQLIIHQPKHCKSMKITIGRPHGPYRKRRKIVLAMNLTAIILLSATLTVSARGNAQKVTLKVKDAPLKTVFVKINEQTGFNFLYSDEDLANTNVVTLNVTDAPLQKVLDLCFKDQPLIFSINNNTIVIKEKGIAGTTLPDREQLPVDVKGRVVNEKGEPVAGATVTVKGTRNATATDADGNFTLGVSNPNMILVISGASIETIEIKINARTEIIIKVKTKVSSLDEVQVIGYGTTTKRLSTGSVSTVTEQEISTQTVNNPLSALEARVPGLYIAQQTGVPGGNFTVQLRGQNSIAAGNTPLFIIDGVPFSTNPLSSSLISGAITRQGNPLNNINSADIESIEVLKDGEATAIYGSRGANGVILITTKKGKAGKPSVDIKISQGFGKLSSLMKMLNTRQYLEMRKEAFKNDNVAPTIANAPDLVLWDTTRYTEWQKELIGGTAKFTDVQGALSGGTERLRFLIGGSFQRETTVFPGDFSNKRGTLNTNISYTSFNEKLNISLTTNYSVSENYLPQADPTRVAHVLAPNAPEIYQTDGSFNWENSTWTNPLATLLQYYRLKQDNLIVSSILTYDIFQELQFKLNTGYTGANTDELGVQPLKSFNPAITGATGYSAFNKGNSKSWIVEPQLNWSKAIGKSVISLMIGSTFQQNHRNAQAFAGIGYTSDVLIENPGAAARIVSMSNEDILYRYASLFGRAKLEIKQKYLFSLTGRRDGSSKFGENKRLANFGAASGAWIFTKEHFLQRLLPILSFGKLRASYGITGNDQIADYGYLDTYSSTAYPYQGIASLYPAQLANPNYSWETNKKMEAALELGFYNDKLILNLGYYRNRSSNLLVGYPLPRITGFSFIQSNLPALVQNTGWEVELSTAKIGSNNFNWTGSFNLTIPKNELISFPNIKLTTYANKYVVGKSLFIQNVYHNLGVDPQTGMFQIEDVDGDGKISSPNDRRGKKEAAQQFYGGFNNSIQYKRWELSVLFQFVKQTGYNYMYSNFFTQPGFQGNQPVYVLGRWQQPGDKTDIQRFTQSTSSSVYTAYINARSSDSPITDASFLRVRTVQLSYDIPATVINRLKIASSQIFIQGQNLFTTTAYKGLNPENNGAARLAPLQSVTFGLQFNL